MSSIFFFRHVFCAHCRSYKTYRIRGPKYRCQRCGYTFHDFSNRWINDVRIPCKTWLWILKLFELEVSARKISQQVGISYPTALKAVTLIRKSILANTPEGEELLRGEIELDESYFGGKHKGKRGRDYTAADAAVDKADAANDEEWARRGRFCG